MQCLKKSYVITWFNLHHHKLWQWNFLSILLSFLGEVLNWEKGVFWLATYFSLEGLGSTPLCIKATTTIWKCDNQRWRLNTSEGCNRGCMVGCTYLLQTKHEMSYPIWNESQGRPPQWRNTRLNQIEEGATRRCRPCAVRFGQWCLSTQTKKDLWCTELDPSAIK